MGVAWIIGFTIYFRKRYKRKKLKRKIAAGKAVQTRKPSKIPEENVIVPPDPAILLGHRLPGEHAFEDGNNNEQEQSGKSKQSNDIGPASLANLSTNGALPVMRTSEEMLVPPKR